MFVLFVMIIVLFYAHGGLLTLRASRHFGCQILYTQTALYKLVVSVIGIAVVIVLSVALMFSGIRKNKAKNLHSSMHDRATVK